MDTIAKVTALLVEYGPVGAAVLAACALALGGIAPLTKTKWDDKLLGYISKAQGALAWLLVKFTPRGARAALVDEVKRVDATRAAKK